MTITGDIIDAARKGDRASMKKLYEQTVRYAASVCSRYISDDEDVRDVLQETYVTIFEQLNRFRFKDERSLLAWISRVAMSRSIDMLRQKKKSIITVHEDLPEDIHDEEPDVSGLDDSSVLAAVRSLPDGYRTVLNMYVFEQMSHKEISQALGISEGTSASQYHRAKAALAAALKKKIDE